jgi:Dolichyl-phosphate-mannose-protein mannosyltransferase
MFRWKAEHSELYSSGNRSEGARAKTSTNEPLIVAAVLLASTVVYWHHIRSAPIGYDEAITLLTTSGHAIHPDWSLGMSLFEPSAHLTKILSDLFNFDVHPPLYFWTVALWRCLFGGSIETARWLSAAFILASIPLLSCVACNLKMKWPVVPTIVFALSGAALQYAFTARSYAMATFLIVLTLYLGERKSKWTGASAAACVATHYFAALVIAPVLVVYCICQWKTDRRWSMLTAISFIILCAPLLVLVMRQLHARPDQYAGFGTWRAELKAMLKGSIGSALPGSSVFLVRRLTVIIGACFAAMGGFYALRHKAVVVPVAYCAFLAGFFVMADATNKSIISMPGHYYLGLGAPLLALLVSFGMSAFLRASAPLALLLVAPLALLLFVGAATATPIFNNGDFRSIVGRVRSECNSCAIVVGAGSGYGRGVPAQVLYEAKGMNVFVLNSQDNLDEVVDRIGRQRAIYFIPTEDSITSQAEESFTKSPAAERQEGYFRFEFQ